MLPIAKPPNAIVFGSNYFEDSDVIQKGFLTNIISIIAVKLVVYYFMLVVFGLH
jgi:sodium-dependent dicarboxylate transporter 2/3/5